MTTVHTPQTKCRVGFGRVDITPPVGIYHRMWGAALHDRATGVHQPLTATAMWLEATDGSAPKLVLGLDHCVMDRSEFERIRHVISSTLPVPYEDVFLAMSHTHGSAWMSRSRSHLPGGEIIGPYLDRLAEVCVDVSRKAGQGAKAGALVFGTARCSLAAHRDFWDANSKQFVCGFNPTGPTDDTVTVMKAIADDDGVTLGTVVNYACHPTTLAWQNTLISPDYVGSMRAVVEGHTGAPCLFLQGASGDLGPREGYVGDTTVADRNGRQLGFAALSGLEAMPRPGTKFGYVGPVVSGAILGAWEHWPVTEDEAAGHRVWNIRHLAVPLAYRHELPTVEATRAELAKWEAEEATARAASNTDRVSECRARAEQMTRQLARLTTLPEGKAYPLPVSIARLGKSLWVFTPGELYHAFQVALRERFPDFAVVICTVTNDWQPGYIPAASAYDQGIYQEIISAVSPGSLEALTETVSRELRKLAG